MLQLAGARESMHTELEGNLLIRPRAFPDGDGKLYGLEIYEIGREFVCGQCLAAPVASK